MLRVCINVLGCGTTALEPTEKVVSRTLSALWNPDVLIGPNRNPSDLFVQLLYMNVTAGELLKDATVFGKFFNTLNKAAEIPR